MRQDKMVIGYIETKNLPLLSDNDIKCLNVVNLAFGMVKEDHAVTWDSMGHTNILTHARNLNPDLKVVLSVGGWGCGGFSEAAASEEGREVFARSAVRILRQYRLDGIDIDWEYPCIGISGIAASEDDKENFTLLIKKLRQELDAVGGRRLLLTAAAGGDAYYTRCTQMDRVINYLDYIMLMTYDLRGGFSSQTGHHTNLYGNCMDMSAASVENAVHIFENAGVPREKIVIGAAFYSRLWKGVPDRNNGLMQVAATMGEYGPGYGTLISDYIEKNGYRRFWDGEAKAPFLFNGSEFISYDDEASIRCKLDYIKKQELAGIMFWEYSQDTTRTLIPLMAENIKGG